MPDGDLTLWPLWPAISRDMLLRPALPNAASSPHYISVGQLADFITAGGVTLPLPVAQGGTGSTTSAGGLSALGGAPLNSPVFTGTPQAPTQLPGDNSQRLATTAFVQAALAALPPVRASVLISDTAPSAPQPGDLWFDSRVAQLFVRYADPDSSAWVIAVNQPGPAGATGPQGPAGPAGATDWAGITGKPATYPPTVPIAQADITNLVADLAAKAPLSSPGFVTGVSVAGATNPLPLQLATGAGTNCGINFSVSGGRTWQWAVLSSNGSMVLWDNNAAANRIIVDAAGACSNTTGSWAAISESDLKVDVRPYRRSLAALRRLQPVRFRYRAGTPFAPPDGPSGRVVGLMADAVEGAFPELVGTTSVVVDGEPREVRTVASGSLVYAMLNAIREMSDEIDALKARLR